MTVRRSIINCAVFILIVSGIVVPESLGMVWENYSPVAHYLSELGAIEAPYDAVMKWAGFLPVALSSLFLLFSLFFSKKMDVTAKIGLVLIAIGIPSGYLLAVLFPCDFGCPVHGSPRQSIHNLGGLIQYPLGSIGFILLGLSRSLPKILRLGAVAVGMAMAIGFVMMIIPDMNAVRGAWQRLGDYSAFIYLGFASFYLLRPARIADA